MSNAVDFLECLGQDARLRYATSSELELALAQANLDPAFRAAIGDADPARLEALLGAPATICCLVRGPGHEDEEEDEDADEDENENDDLNDDDKDPNPDSHRALACRGAAAQ